MILIRPYSSDDRPNVRPAKDWQQNEEIANVLWEMRLQTSNNLFTLQFKAVSTSSRHSMIKGSTGDQVPSNALNLIS